MLEDQRVWTNSLAWHAKFYCKESVAWHVLVITESSHVVYYKHQPCNTDQATSARSWNNASHVMPAWMRCSWKLRNEGCCGTSYNHGRVCWELQYGLRHSTDAVSFVYHVLEGKLEYNQILYTYEAFTCLSIYRCLFPRRRSGQDVKLTTSIVWRV